MARFNFNLRQANAENETLINLVVRWDNQKIVISTGEYSKPTEWNKSKQRLDTSKSNAKRLLNQQVNTRLSKIISDAESYFSEFQTLQHRTPAKQELLELLNSKFHNKVPKEEKKDLIGFIESIVNEMKNGINPKTGRPYSKRTPSTYNQCLNKLREFTDVTRIKVDFDSIDMDFYQSFYEFLVSKKGYKLNYVGKIIKTLKTFLNEALERNLTSNFSHKGRRFVAPREKVSNIYLNLKELELIYNLDLTKEPRLEKVRDLFIFGCYTGLRFSDFTRVKPEYINLDDKLINIPTQKTEERVSLPILPIAEKIIAKYRNKTTNSLPPSIANQTFNRYIKEVVARIPELNEDITVDYFSMGKKISRTYKKWEKVTSHTARRSFATNLVLLGYNSQLIMKITGHKSESAFQTYIKMSPIEGALIILNGFPKDGSSAELKIVG